VNLRDAAYHNGTVWTWLLGPFFDALLKTTDNTREITIVDTEGWSPNFMFGSNIINQFSQPFSIKVYNERLLASGIYNYNNWGIEMGDSDTFIYKPWK
jgi:hypothetical protein